METNRTCPSCKKGELIETTLSETKPDIGIAVCLGISPASA